MKKLKKGLVAALACLMLLGGPVLESSAACSHNGPVYSSLVDTSTTTKYCSTHKKNCKFTVYSYVIKCSKCGEHISTTTRTVHQ